MEGKEAINFIQVPSRFGPHAIAANPQQGEDLKSAILSMRSVSFISHQWRLTSIRTPVLL